jgi:hypothetical protein
MSHLTATATLATRRAWAEHGMTTAEYAGGTVSACSFAGLLFKLLTSSFGQSLLEGLLSKITQLLPF